MIRLVLFDWNGTLLSDATAGLEATNNLLPMYNIKPITMKKYRETIDIPITKFYSRVGISEEMFFEEHARIQETFHGFYEKRIENGRARAGTRALLKWLRSKGISSVILSNHTVGGIEAHLKRLKMDRYVDAILANDSIMHTGLKDKAKRAQDYIKKGGFGRRQVLVVGDAPEEARIARRLGSRSVLISDGWYSVRRLKEAKPDYLIRRPDKLIEIIKSIG